MKSKQNNAFQSIERHFFVLSFFIVFFILLTLNIGDTEKYGEENKRGPSREKQADFFVEIWLS